MNFSFYAIFLFVLSIIHSKRNGVKSIQKHDFVKNKEKQSYALFSKGWERNRPKIYKSGVLEKRQLLHLKCVVPIKEKSSLLCITRNNEETCKKVKTRRWMKTKEKRIYFHINNINEVKKSIKRIKKNKTVLSLLQYTKLIEQYLKKWKYNFLHDFNRTKIITKFFVASSLAVTLLNIFGLKPESIALHDKRIIRSFEFYRIITSALFYGDISLYVLTNIYMFYLESQKLEMSLGSSEVLSFYLSQIIILSVICCYLKKPFFSTALLKSLLFVNCMLRPDQKAHLIFGINIKNLYLPYLSILIDVLHAQKLNAALSGLLGVLSGSAYYMLNVYMYNNYNIKIFKIPFFLRKYLDSFDLDEFIG